MVDTTPPVITLNGDANITIEAGSAYVDEGAKWTDAVDGNGTLIGVGQVNTLVLGEYQVVFNYFDQAGNQANSVVRKVNVVDTTPPVITLDGNGSIIHPVWVDFVEPGYRAHDLVDGNLTAEVLVTGNVKHVVPGQYLLEYHVADRAGNSAVSKVCTVQVVNHVPTGLILSNHTIPENSVSGSIIGLFKTVDPDDPDGIREYRYELLDNNISAESTSFAVDRNGTLRTTRPLDWEKQRTHSISTLSEDEFGGTITKNFLIQVVDTFRPILQTVEKYEWENNTYRLSGEILDMGGHPLVEECGILVGVRSDPTLEDTEILKLVSQNSGTGLFSVSFLPPDSLVRKFYFRAYAINQEGVSYGFTGTINRGPRYKLAERLGGRAIAGVTGWWESPWLGTFYHTLANGWIMHQEFGWVFVFPLPQDGGFWIWQEMVGWGWTNDSSFPYFFLSTGDQWTFFHGSSNDQLLFYHFLENEWKIYPKQKAPSLP